MSFFIMFEGSDKTGKDTLIRAFHKAMGYKYPCINRGTGTSYSYGRFRNRKLNYDEYLELETQLINNLIVFQLYCDIGVLAKRFEDTNEQHIKVEEIDKVQEKYTDWQGESNLMFYEINTNRSIEETVNEMVEIVQKFEKERLFQLLDNLNFKLTFKDFKEFIGKEILNIKLDFNLTDIDENQLSKLMSKELLSFFQEYDKEKPEYQEIYHSLKNKIRNEMKIYQQPLESRRFTYSGNSCISFVQALYRENKLKIFAVFRSSNIEMLPLDLYGLSYIAKEINKDYFNIKEENIQIILQISSLHFFGDEEEMKEIKEYA